MELIIALIVGLCAGLHTSTWGMYKDAPYEGFTWPKYFRSTVIGALAAIGVVMFTDLDVSNAGGLLVLYAYTYVIERAAIEYWKTFLRVQDQSKYFIPMQFSFRGNVVANNAVRIAAGAAYLAGVVLVVYGVHTLQKMNFSPGGGLMVVLILGSIGGWISAFGGAWKDAPKEGFETLKFFRSPLMALGYALLLANFTESYLFIVFGALGLTIGTIETYKTFFFPSKPRGKFAGKEIQFEEWLTRRKKFVPLYVAIWVAVIVTTIVAFVQPHQGLI